MGAFSWLALSSQRCLCVCGQDILVFDICRLAQIGNQVRLAWTRPSPHGDPDSNWPLLSSHLLIFLFLSHWSCFNLTLTGAPDKTHYNLNYAIYLSAPHPFICTVSPLSASLFPISHSDALGLVRALSGLRWCFPSDSITSLSVLCISVLLISLGGTITFVFIKKTEQMWVSKEEIMNGQHRRCWREKKSFMSVEGCIPWSEALRLSGI